MVDYWKEEAMEFANHYEHNTLVSLFLKKRTKLLLDLVRCENNKKASILDLGCGNGVHMEMLSNKGNLVCGHDISPVMIGEAAKRRLFEHKLTLGDACEVPYKNGFFNLAIAIGLLDYVESPERVLMECNRVLKEHGTLIFTIPLKPSVFWLIRSGFGNRIRKAVLGLPPIRNVCCEAEVYELAYKAGFKPVYVDSVWNCMWIVKAVKEKDVRQ